MHQYPAARRTVRPLAAFAYAFIALLPLGFFPLSEWMATRNTGTKLLLWGQAPMLLAGLGSFAAIPVVVFGLFRRRYNWKRALICIVLCGTFTASCIGGFAFGKSVRMSGMAAFVERSRSLLDAIRAFEADQGAPPNSLSELVPKYLTDVPLTGMPAYPDFEYSVGSDAQRRFDENPWALSVFTPSAGINFDMMLYLPRQNYPQTAYGGWLEPIGEWVYVHE